jgi:hypothetical protein
MVVVSTEKTPRLFRHSIFYFFSIFLLHERSVFVVTRSRTSRGYNIDDVIRSRSDKEKWLTTFDRTKKNSVFFYTFIFSNFFLLSSPQLLKSQHAEYTVSTSFSFLCLVSDYCMSVEVYHENNQERNIDSNGFRSYVVTP